jgi:hypothetical protein
MLVLIPGQLVVVLRTSVLKVVFLVVLSVTLDMVDGSLDSTLCPSVLVGQRPIPIPLVDLEQTVLHVVQCIMVALDLVLV